MVVTWSRSSRILKLWCELICIKSTLESGGAWLRLMSKWRQRNPYVRWCRKSWFRWVLEPNPEGNHQGAWWLKGWGACTNGYQWVSNECARVEDLGGKRVWAQLYKVVSPITIPFELEAQDTAKCREPMSYEVSGLNIKFPDWGKGKSFTLTYIQDLY